MIVSIQRGIRHPRKKWKYKNMLIHTNEIYGLRARKKSRTNWNHHPRQISHFWILLYGQGQPILFSNDTLTHKMDSVPLSVPHSSVILTITTVLQLYEKWRRFSWNTLTSRKIDYNFTIVVFFFSFTYAPFNSFPGIPGIYFVDPLTPEDQENW